MIGSRGIGTIYGGVERVLDNLCPNLAELGHRVDVYSSFDNVSLERENINTIKIRSVKTKHLDTITRSCISFIKAAGNYDIIHFHSLGSGILSPLARLANQKSIVTIHGLDAERDKWGRVARTSLQLAERALISYSDGITVVSKPLEIYFDKKYNKKTKYIPNGSSKQRYVAPSQFMFGLGLQPKNYILFSSRLTPEKGAHDLIQAYSKLDTKMLLVIAGKAESQQYENYLRSISKSEKIIFVGHLNTTQLSELYSNAYIFALPSYLEGMSMSLLEAISFCNVPLVSNIDENKAVVGSDGFYFENKNINNLAEILHYLIKNPLSVMNIEIALKNRQHTNWLDISRQYEEFYQLVMDGNPSDSGS